MDIKPRCSLRNTQTRETSKYLCCYVLVSDISCSHFTHPTIQPSNILVDPVSLSLLNGSTVDFTTELIGSRFEVADNPHAKGGCGCGISWELKTW